MEAMHARCAGLDVSEKDAKVCIRVAGGGRSRGCPSSHVVVLDDVRDLGNA